jgi:hypothetical protein
MMVFKEKQAFHSIINRSKNWEIFFNQNVTLKNPLRF